MDKKVYKKVEHKCVLCYTAFCKRNLWLPMNTKNLVRVIDVNHPAACGRHPSTGGELGWSASVNSPPVEGWRGALGWFIACNSKITNNTT